MSRRTLAARWGVLGISIVAYSVAGIVLRQPFHEGARALNYFDLRIYSGAARRLSRGEELYNSPIWKGLGFTYPPFAALLFLPLAFVSFSVGLVAVTAMNIALLVWLLRRAQLIPSGRITRLPAAAPPYPAGAWSIAALAAAVGLWLEPISVTFGYGQVNLLVTALVIFDVSRPGHCRTNGAAIGLAGAIKLTPLFFLIYLFLCGRRRAAALGSAVFAATICLGYALLPRDSARYWGGLFLNSSHVGNVADIANQSLRGAIARITPDTHPTAAWYLLIGAVVLSGLAMAVHAARRGDEAAGFSLTAVSALLASPISWTHHWTIAVPALLLLARRAYEQRSRLLAAATGALLLLGYTYAPEHLADHDHPIQHGLGTVITTDPYVITAMFVLAVTAIVVMRQARSHGRSVLLRPARVRRGC